MRRILATACFVPVVAMAGTGPQPVFERPHELLVQAIRTGHAQGIMRGAVAGKFTQQFRSNGVLLARADVIAHFPRDDCKRLNVVYTKHDVVTPSGPKSYDLAIKMSYCLDGRPPAQLESKR